jgi:hypothetical protein
MVLFYNLMHLPYLLPAKSPAALQPDWIKPKFCDFVIALDMNMIRLIPVASIEKEAERANS